VRKHLPTTRSMIKTMPRILFSFYSPIEIRQS
jgi:hypothetical protein